MSPVSADLFADGSASRSMMIAAQIRVAELEKFSGVRQQTRAFGTFRASQLCLSWVKSGRVAWFRATAIDV
jgi:hypothetical protein